MRILAEENIPRAAVQKLRDQGHDVSWIRETSPGVTDEVVIGQAVKEQRAIITFD